MIRGVAEGKRNGWLDVTAWLGLLRVAPIESNFSTSHPCKLTYPLLLSSSFVTLRRHVQTPT
jgi:hypothetical protein